MDDKLKGLFPEHKHGENIAIKDVEKADRICGEISTLEDKLLLCTLVLFRKRNDSYYIECEACFKLMIQFHRDIANLWEELANIKVDKPKNVV